MWPHLRSALVVFHVVAITLMAFPAPSGGMNRSSWKDPTVQAEFEAWRARLEGWGWSLTPTEFEDGLWSFASGYMEVRDAVIDPLKPYYAHAGTWQSWRMFVAPHLYPARLHVDVREGDVWRTVYVTRSEEHTWLRPVFDHDRMRSAVFRYAWKKYSRMYRELVTWLAQRAAVDFPEADRIRVRYAKGLSPSPEQVLEGTRPPTEWILERELDLAAYR